MSDEEESKPEVDDWLTSPFTQISYERVKKDLEPMTFEGFLRVCRSSSDPMVTKWLAKYLAVLELREFLKTGELPK
jgi:hypothetical protein